MIQLALLLILLASSGCATFRPNPVQSPKEWPKTEGAKPSVALSVFSEVLDNGKVVAETGAAGMGIFERRVVKAYTQSGLFSSISVGREPADRFIEVRTSQDARASIGMAILSGLTLTLFPLTSTNEFKVVTTFKDRDGRVLGTIEKSEVSPTMFGLFMVFAMPTNFPTPVLSRILTELNWATLQEAKQKGWL